MRAAFALRLFFYASLAFVTLELAARVEDSWRYGAPLFARYSIDEVFQHAPFGKVGKPGASYLKWSMNSFGYRSPEPQKNRQTIITFGASETFGLYESAGKEYPRQLDALLESRHPGTYQVVNIAIPGLRIGHVAYLEDAIRSQQAKYVVVYPSPANYIGADKPNCGKVIERPQTPQPSHGLGLRLSGRVEQFAKQRLPQSIMAAWRRFSIYRETRGVQLMERVPEVSVQAFRADLECVVRAVRSQGAEPILATHATLFGSEVHDADADMLVAWRRFYPELEEPGFLDLEQRSNRALLEVAAENKVRVARADTQVAPGRENFADFVHFTDRGAARMAEILAATLTEPDQPTAAGRQQP